jgi:hypothetical protein
MRRNASGTARIATRTRFVTSKNSWKACLTPTVVIIKISGKWSSVTLNFARRIGRIGQIDLESLIGLINLVSPIDLVGLASQNGLTANKCLTTYTLASK